MCDVAILSSADITIASRFYDFFFRFSMVSIAFLSFSAQFIHERCTHHRPVHSNISAIQVHRMNCKCGLAVHRWHRLAMIMAVRKVVSPAVVDCLHSNAWHRPVCITRHPHDQLHHTMDLTYVSILFRWSDMLTPSLSSVNERGEGGRERNLRA